MAQLRDLIVNGASRFLGVVMFNNETHFNNISNCHNNVNFNSNISLSSSSTLNLLNTTAAAVATYNSPALVIGPSSGTHLEIDSGQIIAKKSINTESSLYLNPSGGQVVIGSGGLSSSGIITVTQGDAAAAATEDTKIAGAVQITGGIYTSLNSYFADTIEVNGGVKAYNTSIMQNIKPQTTETYNLGVTNNRWLCLYSKNLDISETSGFGGKITANAGINITSGGLDIDAGGIILDSDDLTITAGKINASDSTVTHIIAGTVQITQGDAATATAETGALQITGGIRATAGSYFASTVEIDGVLNVDNTAIMRAINPETKDTYNLGASENRWKYLYAQYLNISSTSTLSGKVTAEAGIEIKEGNLDIKTGNATITSGALKVNNAEVTNEIIGNLIVGNSDNEAVLTVKNGIGAQLYYINNIENNNMAYFTYNSTDDSVDLIFI